jgi:hypothetical protein
MANYMRLFYSFIFMFFLFFIGCSRTYRVTKYFSKEQLYENFNNSAQNKNLKVVLNNDSSFLATNSAIVFNDSLILNTNSEGSNKTFPLLRVKQVSYKNHWKGIVPGLLIGTIVGGAFGSTGWVLKPKSGGNPPLKFDQGQGIFIGALLGAVVGSVVGYIFGYNFNYEFR